MNKDIKIALIGERLKNRTFNGANKALPVLASALYNGGYQNVKQLDLENPTITLDRILDQTKDVDFVGISGLSTQLEDIDDHAKQIYDSLIDKNTPIIIGGYAAKGTKEIAINSPHITAFFNGEGEEGIVQIANSIASGTFKKDMSNIGGLCYVDSSGKYHESIAKRVRNLDSIDQNFGFTHIPEKHNMEIFQDKEGHQIKTAQLYSQRGCVNKCGFCNKSIEEKTVVHVGDAWFEKMVKDLAEKGFQAIYLDDDTETINQKNFHSKMQILHKYGFKVGINTRIDIEADRLRKGQSNIEFAKNHGAVYQFFGVEHIDPGVLVAVGKFNGSEEHQWKRASHYRDDVKAVFKEMERVGLVSSNFIMLGLPKKDKEKYTAATLNEDKEAIKFALDDCNPDYLNFNILRFMPGTIAADVPSTNYYKNPFACVRPTGNKIITGAYFVPRIAHKLNYKIQDYHPIYKCFESLAPDQPRSTAITPERAYESIKYAIELINNRIDNGNKATQLFVDKSVLGADLIKKENNGKYYLAPFEMFATAL